jgi:DNA (cytosine-5)-methyltransferase 1
MTYGRQSVGIELFCGAGGMSLGFEQAGLNVAAAFDIEPINVDIHTQNHPGCRTLREDVTRLTGKKIRSLSGLGNRRIDVLFGGPPCQGFSEIGKGDVDDPRNLLLLDFARLVAELRPSYFVIENVKGVLFNRTSATLQGCLDRIDRAGYSIIVPIRAINASDFGVPQNRKRVFIIGARKGMRLPEYPAPTASAGPHGRPDGVTVWDAIGDLPDIDQHPELLESDVYRGSLGMPSRYAQILRGELRDPDDLSKERRDECGGLTGCMRVLHRPETIRRFEKTAPGTCERKSRLFRLSKEGISSALRAGTSPAQGSFTAARPIHPVRPRCISVREGARLHSFPDWYAFPPTKWHGFRQLGNAVPPLLARSVAREIHKHVH